MCCSVVYNSLCCLCEAVCTRLHSSAVVSARLCSSLLVSARLYAPLIVSAPNVASMWPGICM
jgi:hypothetical protein